MTVIVTVEASVSHLRVENLKVSYGSRVAIHDATFSVGEGELCVLVGPSGSGKSTILRAIAGYAPIEHGDIYVGERHVNTLPPQDRDIAMVFQQRALYPHMTVWENWAFPLEAVRCGRDEIRRRVAEIAEMLQMTAFLDRYPRHLSGGQQQRVAIGRALIRRPKAFLLDEPLSGLDAKLRIETRSYIRRLHGDLGVTMVYVTHDQVEAQAIGDKIVVLNDSLVQQVGSPDEIYNHPANVFVAEFLGSPPINLIDCEADIEGERVRLSNRAHTWLLGPEQSAPIRQKLQGREVVLGVRPEDIRLHREPGEERIPAAVYVTEPLGHEMIIDLSFEQMILRVREDRERGLGESLKLNERVYMEFLLPRVHLFDRLSRNCIS
jgi:multiple sugar transport system ATP-binding protein